MTEEERLRGWLKVLLESNDAHAASCARHALDGDPAPDRRSGPSELPVRGSAGGS